jgi:hypothetical protein
MLRQAYGSAELTSKVSSELWPAFHVIVMGSTSLTMSSMLAGVKDPILASRGTGAQPYSHAFVPQLASFRG